MSSKQFVVTSASIDYAEECVTICFDKDNDPVVNQMGLDNFSFHSFYGYGVDGYVTIHQYGLEVGRITPQGFALANDFLLSILVDVKEVPTNA